MYKFGYYIVTSSGFDKSPERLLCVLKKGRLSFAMANIDLSPAMKDYHSPYLYYLGLPVVYMQSKDGVISDIFPVKDIPVAQKESLNGKGFEIEIPSGKDDSPKLWLNGKCIINYTDPSQPIPMFSNAVMLIHIGEAFYKQCHKFTNLASFEEASVNKVKELSSSIKAINLHKELEGLKVRISDYLKTKVGDDDTYYVYREAYVDSPIIKNDTYLSNLVGLGEREIARDSGYSNNLAFNIWNSLSAMGYYMGEYDEAKLEQEKLRIISNYSFEEHLGTLLGETLYDYRRKESLSEKMKDDIMVYTSILNEQFHVADINKNDEWRKLAQKWSIPSSDHVNMLTMMNKIVENITTDA